jgi:hypothetical protein
MFLETFGMMTFRIFPTELECLSLASLSKVGQML